MAKPYKELREIMWGRMKVRGLLAAKEEQDEQTDDLGGFPRTLGAHAAANGLLETIVFERRVPPCTGYDRDYEEVERVYDDKPGY